MNDDNKGRRWYGHILRIDEEKIPKKILNMKIKKKVATRDTEIILAYWVMKDVTKKKEGYAMGRN
jgi:hypothetical protein